MALPERVAVRWGANYVVAGTGDFLSSGRALEKTDALNEILQRFFQDSAPYNDEPIAQNDAKTAIKYAASKKLTKAKRKGAIGAVKFSGFVAGAATGATVGSVVPVAGTVAGGVLGGVAVGTAVSVGATALDHVKRKAKGIYKVLRGTRGAHRRDAAEALLYCAIFLQDDDPKCMAAMAALRVILDGDFEDVLLPTEVSIDRLADRMKSN